MISLSQPTTIIENKENKGVFEITGLYPGYGVTIGNTLRRVLLSSLEGAAITQVRIKGVEHEFSTIDGIMEDVVTILLNLKQVRLKSHSDEPQKATLKVKGEKMVTAADFNMPSQVELVSDDVFIAQITNKSTELEIEIQIEKGIGYVPSELRKKEKQEIGTITLDAIFTPVKRVSTKIDDMRVGDRTDFNRLRIEIETDGTISPEEAFYQATDILIKEFEIILSGVQGNAPIKEEVDSDEEPKKKKEAKKTVKKTAKK